MGACLTTGASSICLYPLHRERERERERRELTPHIQYYVIEEKRESKVTTIKANQIQESSIVAIGNAIKPKLNVEEQ